MGLIDLPQSKWGSGTGRQVILKGDFFKEQAAILQVAELMPPPTPEWVDATEIKVPATADCPAKIIMSGFPNILQPGMVGGGLTDGRYRENIADVTLDFDLSASLWGSEKVSQWYLNYALAGNADGDFTLKAMPYMRVKSQASQVISLGTLVTPATGIGYGFTTDELVGGMIYVHTGASRGLVRPITANNNDNSTGGAITYGGSALTLAAGDWFAVLPPATNFRLSGTVFNNASGNIEQLVRSGNYVQRVTDTQVALGANPNGVIEDITLACPLACAFGGNINQNSVAGYGSIGHPSTTRSTGAQAWRVDPAMALIPGNGMFVQVQIQNCRVFVFCESGVTVYIYPTSYIYPKGRGF